MRETLADIINRDIKKEFENTFWRGSFDEFIELVEKDPKRHTRTAFQYLNDMIGYFGKSPIVECGENLVKYNLFDDPFNNGENAIYGNHRALLRFVHSIEVMAKQIMKERILILRGPVATAKTSIIRLLTKGMEEYSKTPEGGFYKFSWVFPKENAEISPGFRLPGKQGKDISYAHFNAEDVLKIPCQLNENPIMLYPRKQRIKLLTDIIEKSGQDITIPEKVKKNDICFNCQNIYNFLLAKYDGDVEKVFRHVLVERFMMSEIDRTGIATVQPVHNMEGKAQLVSWESSKYAQISQFLKGIVLHLFEGKWADANRGIIHMTDMFKRNAAYLQHLLSAVEENFVDFNDAHAYIDVVIIGSTNCMEYKSFSEGETNAGLKDRILPSDINYILQYSEEAEIYKKQMRAAGYMERKSGNSKHICPHALDALALWAVTTRLKPIESLSYESTSRLREILDACDLVKKALLYNGEFDSDSFTFNEKEVLKDRGLQRAIRNEHDDEGMTGISPRQVQNLIANIISRKEYEEETKDLKTECLSIFRIFKGIRRLYDDEIGGFDSDSENILDDLVTRYKLKIFKEVKLSIAGVEEAVLIDKIREYVQHVKADLNKEEIFNPITGRYEKPSNEKMKWVEDNLIDIKISSEGERLEYRNRILHDIASLVKISPENEPAIPEDIDYKSLFRGIYESLEHRVYYDRVKHMKMSLNELGKAFEKYETPQFNALEEKQKKEVERILGNMILRFDYCPNCAKEVVLYAISQDSINAKEA